MAKINLVGKRFVKVTPVEVIDATENQVMLQDVNKTHDNYVVPRSDFESDYKLGEDILEHFADAGTEEDMAVSTEADATASTDENNTKGIK